VQKGMEDGAGPLRFRGKFVNVAGWSGPVSEPCLSWCVERMVMKRGGRGFWKNTLTGA